MTPPSFDPILDHWIATWAHIRDIEVLRLDGWPFVQVAGPSRETELVCVDPGPAELTRLLRHVAGDPRAMLTVAAVDVGACRRLPLPDGVRVDRDDETLMSTVLSPVPAPPLAEAEGLVSRWDTTDHRTTYSLETQDAVAATGSMGVLDGWATFDRIETMPAFRRRGLGEHVMRTLTARATELGATHGVLAASAQGRSLYERLGWSVVLELCSWMGT